MSSAIGGDLADALQYLEAALAIIDAHDASAQIGAHVDLGICQLKDYLAIDNRLLEATVQTLRASAPRAN